MDTTEVATHLGTTPRTFRQFLRSPMSTYQAVGSGARYDFTERDLPTITKRFAEWQGAGKPKPASATPTPATRKPKADKDREKDAVVWAEEGPIVIADIRDPRVRARVKAAAQAAEDRLAVLLMAKGMHVAQGYAPKAKAS